ncbi:unnamed protein product, partial [Nesidiocoris tenuis]
KSARNCPILKCCAPLSTLDAEGPNCSDNDLLAGTPSGRRNDFTRKPRARPRGTTRVTAGEVSRTGGGVRSASFQSHAPHTPSYLLFGVISSTSSEWKRIN